MSFGMIVLLTFTLFLMKKDLKYLKLILIQKFNIFCSQSFVLNVNIFHIICLKYILWKKTIKYKNILDNYISVQRNMRFLI